MGDVPKLRAVPVRQESARERAHRLMTEAQAAAAEMQLEAVQAFERAIEAANDAATLSGGHVGVREALRQLAKEAAARLDTIKALRERK